MGWRLDFRGASYCGRMDRDNRNSVQDVELHTVEERDLGIEFQALHPPEERRRFVERLSKNVWDYESFSGGGIDGHHRHRNGTAVCYQALRADAIRQAGQSERQVPADWRSRHEIRAAFQPCLESHGEHGLR